MRNFLSRKDKHEEMITDFLKNKEKESIHTKLYSREIRSLEARYPQIRIEKGQKYLNTDLFICTIKKV